MTLAENVYILNSRYMCNFRFPLVLPHFCPFSSGKSYLLVLPSPSFILRGLFLSESLPLFPAAPSHWVLPIGEARESRIFQTRPPGKNNKPTELTVRENLGLRVLRGWAPFLSWETRPWLPLLSARETPHGPSVRPGMATLTSVKVTPGACQQWHVRVHPS